MRSLKLLVLLTVSGSFAMAQNEQDAVRYSQLGANGTSRFNAMGGAFGAVGADVSCASTNPAGLALFRRGELSYSGGLRISRQTVNAYNKSSSQTNSYFNFNSFGFAIPWLPDNSENRNVFALTLSQPVNYNNSTLIKGYTNNSSIAKDMLNLAVAKGSTQNLNGSYEGLGFDTYLIDTVDNKFFTYVDTKRSVLQSRTIATSGRVNDINISFAHSHKDKYYIGASLGLPQVRYESDMHHTESDDRDSMRVTLTSPQSYTTTYIDGLPAVDTTWLGFNSLEYREYFKTTGGGVNLKIGAVARINDEVRLGFYYHSPTYYSLTDVYYNSMSVTFDRSKNLPISKTYPEKNGGTFSYKLITPSRVGLNAAFIIKTLAVIGIDYETVNYRNARLQSDDPSDFSDVNSIINSTYKAGHNLRIGAELNTKPLMYRVGYQMQGSPYGDVFTGDYVRNTLSLGVGFRTVNGFYFDFTFLKSYVNEPYNMFVTLPTRPLVKHNNSSVNATIGFKF